MRAMFRLVAIVALIATIGGEVPEYSETVLKDLKLTDGKFADVINRDVKIEFMESRNPEVDGLRARYLVPATTLNFNSSKNCGGALGIKLPDNKYCDIDFFAIGVDCGFFNSKEKFLHLALAFKSKTEEAKALVLYVPIFRQPSKYAEAGQQKALKKWADDNEVVTHFPVEALNDIRNKRRTTLSFEWLNDLIRFHITKLETHPLVWRGWKVRPVGFMARPIVLPKNMVQKLVSLGNQ